ncbi:MAG: DegT/DnrJ/EryC1/StrS family aminotransferase [Verrucomicrobia bacterium]|nr:DegT/DnrJ/EryC1/StrS family aminotransferase [Verrucomicrobiota bacterium]
MMKRPATKRTKATVKGQPSTLAISGGKPVCPVKWQVWPAFDNAERKQLLGVLESRKWWYGEKVRQFEAEFAAFQMARFGVSCTNGTAAIEMALRGLGVLPGDEVIVPPYTFIATASAVVTVGAIPVFADIQPDTLCMDPDDVERQLTPRTKAIIPVHVGGYVADMDRLNAIARKHKLRVLEDAAHSWGTQWKGQGTGTLGEGGTFSFQVTKNITAGEGGIFVTNDEALADLCRSYSHCGRRKGSAWYDHDYLGSNLRMTEFQAAVLLAQLSRLEKQTLKRQANAQILDRELREVPGIRLLAPEPRMTRRSYHMYIFRVDEKMLSVSRDKFLDALIAEGVPASKGWYQPLYANGVFRNANQGPANGISAPLFGKGVDYTKVQCPVCEQVCRDAVWIPQNVLLANEDRIRLVAQAIQKVVANADQLR